MMEARSEMLSSASSTALLCQRAFDRPSENNSLSFSPELYLYCLFCNCNDPNAQHFIIILLLQFGKKKRLMHPEMKG